MNETKPLLAIRGLQAGYGDQQVLHSVDIALARGESLAVIGPNGAGKSTLLNTISGIVASRAGSVELDGQDLANRHPHTIVAAGVVQVPEGRQVFPEMSVADNLAMGAYSKPSGASERLATVLETFPRLQDRLRQDAQTLSGGEQQMLAIGRGLMADPTVLLLDEPTLGLAPILVDVVLECLQSIRDSFQTTMLVVEQNVYLARELCDRYVVLNQGRVTHSGDRMPDDPQELMKAFLGSA